VRAAKRKRSGRRLFQFDRDLGVRYVAGADEAGRGCLAGPLVAAAVLFDLEELTLSQRRALSVLNDSKQHTPEMRETLYPVVLRTAKKAVIVSRCVRGIDDRGLHVTNLAAMRDALARVARPGCICLTDGFAVPEFGFEQRAVINGDAQSAAIAAASILAKVSRDRFMKRAAAEADEVKLSVARAVVAGYDGVAEPRHVRGGGVLADAAEVVSEVGGHGRDARSQRVPSQHRSVKTLPGADL
jgi:ribonuclease HII